MPKRTPRSWTKYMSPIVASVMLSYDAAARPCKIRPAMREEKALSPAIQVMVPTTSLKEARINMGRFPYRFAIIDTIGLEAMSKQKLMKEGKYAPIAVASITNPDRYLETSLRGLL